MNGDLMGRGTAGVGAAFARADFVDSWRGPIPATVAELRKCWRELRGTGLFISYGVERSLSGKVAFRRGRPVHKEGDIWDVPDETPIAVSFGREGEWWIPPQLGVIHNNY